MTSTGAREPSRDALGRRQRLPHRVIYAPGHCDPILLTPGARDLWDHLTTWCDATNSLRPTLLDLLEWLSSYDDDAFPELVRAGLVAMADPYLAVNPAAWHPNALWRPEIPVEVRLAIFARDGWKCVHCGARKPLTLDHIYPYSRGGTDEPGNLQTLCRPCNSRKGAKV